MSYEESTDVLDAAADHAKRYLASIGTRRAEVDSGAVRDLNKLDVALSRRGEDPLETLRLLNDVGSPATTASAGGRFFGGVVGSAFPISVAAHWLADAWNQNVCLYDYSPIGATLEQVARGWLLDLLDLPRKSEISFVTGTQMADVVALAAARHALLSRIGWNPEERGLFGAPPISVVVGEEVHATILKALSLLGIGRASITFVRSDSQGRMLPTAIPSTSGPTIICTQAGNVNTGACDRFDDICDAAATSNAWVHVDGAFGLWAAASPTRRYLLKGVSRADSWAIDAHKWLNASYDCGMAVIKDAAHLRAAMSISGSYYSGDFTHDRQPMHLGPDSSRRARGAEVWATIRTLGADGIAQLVDRCCGHARLFATLLAACGLNVLNDVVLNQVIVAADDDAKTEALLEAIRADGTCWLRGSTWKGRRVIRVSVSSWRTTEEDVRCSVAAIARAKERVSA